jgi:hypothetical protein
VPDDVCKMFANLAEYDYREGGDGTQGRPVDVEILGHIFEQSITDLERIHDRLEGRARDDEPSKGRRKKEGAFYTPAFITRYIVEQTLQPVLKERFAAHLEKHRDAAGARVRKVFDAPDEVPDKPTVPQRQALGKRLSSEPWSLEPPAVDALMKKIRRVGISLEALTKPPFVRETTQISRGLWGFPGRTGGFVRASKRQTINAPAGCGSPTAGAGPCPSATGTCGRRGGACALPWRRRSSSRP